MPADLTADVSHSALKELGRTGITDFAGRGGVKVNFASASETAPQHSAALANFERPSNDSRCSSASDMISTRKRQ